LVKIKNFMQPKRAINNEERVSNVGCEKRNAVLRLALRNSYFDECAGAGRKMGKDVRAKGRDPLNGVRGEERQIRPVKKTHTLPMGSGLAGGEKGPPEKQVGKHIEEPKGSPRNRAFTPQKTRGSSQPSEKGVPKDGIPNHRADEWSRNKESERKEEADLAGNRESQDKG